MYQFVLCFVLLVGTNVAAPTLEARQAPAIATGPNANLSAPALIGVPSKTLFECDPEGGAYSTFDVVSVGARALKYAERNQTVLGLTQIDINPDDATGPGLKSEAISFPQSWLNTDRLTLPSNCKSEAILSIFPIGSYGTNYIFGDHGDETDGSDRVAFSLDGYFCAVLTSSDDGHSQYQLCEQTSNANPGPGFANEPSL